MTVVFTAAEPADLVEKHAKQLAVQLGSGNEATRSQLRRFYQEYTGMRNYIRSAHDRQQAYSEKEVALKLLIAKTEYALGRKVIPPRFAEWFTMNISAIGKADDVETFGMYFEALIGFFYGAQGIPSPGGFRR